MERSEVVFGSPQRVKETGYTRASSYFLNHFDVSNFSKILEPIFGEDKLRCSNTK